MDVGLLKPPFQTHIPVCGSLNCLNHDISFDELFINNHNSRWCFVWRFVIKFNGAFPNQSFATWVAILNQWLHCIKCFQLVYSCTKIENNYTSLRQLYSHYTLILSWQFKILVYRIYKWQAMKSFSHQLAWVTSVWWYSHYTVQRWVDTSSVKIQLLHKSTFYQYKKNLNVYLE